jgi:hypothetical protein
MADQDTSGGHVRAEEMTERDRRIGLNEAVFREVNERIRELGDELGLPDRLDLVCECGSDTCAERIAMTADEYERLRADPLLFAVVPGHETGRVEAVVERMNGYDIVRKHTGEPERIAETTNPRG